MCLEHKSRLIKNLKYDTLIMKRKKGRTMSNEIFTVDDNNNAAVRTVSVKGIVESNKKDIFTKDENGNAAVRVVGGGGDSHNKGFFTTQEALVEAYPTGENGDYAIVGTTDTVWVWDSDSGVSGAWVDTDTKGQVTSVNNQTGAVTVQETLVSGTNIKTISNVSLLGSGNITASDIGAVTQNTSTITLAAADWSSHAQTVSVTGVTASNTVIVSPAAASASDYAAAEILCTAQAANSLTFTCVTDPTNNISVNIVILN